jgi:hypothetical protein
MFYIGLRLRRPPLGFGRDRLTTMTIAERRLDRVRSLDIARGLVMVLMAIDHVRVYAAVPAGGPTPAIFFTRWITHFCAPGFVFFAGASAYLHRATLPGLGALSRVLLIRGLWLVVLELTFMRFAWTFNFDVINYNLAGVRWPTIRCDGSISFCISADRCSSATRGRALRSCTRYCRGSA